MKTYTSFKLTTHQCKRLSQVYNGRIPSGGVAWYALVYKGLATDRLIGDGMNIRYDRKITDEGRVAFEQARREGW